MNILKKWFWTKVFEFEYRKVDPDVCCCGSSNCDGDYSHGYVNAKEYYTDIAVMSKMLK